MFYKAKQSWSKNKQKCFLRYSESSHISSKGRNNNLYVLLTCICFDVIIVVFHSLSSSRTTRGWRGRWRRSSERGKSWRGSLGEFWRTWTTQHGMRLTSEINICLIIMDKTHFWLLNGQMTYELKLPIFHADIQHLFAISTCFDLLSDMCTKLWTKRNCLPAISKATPTDRKAVKPNELVGMMTSLPVSLHFFLKQPSSEHWQKNHFGH